MWHYSDWCLKSGRCFKLSSMRSMLFTHSTAMGTSKTVAEIVAIHSRTTAVSSGSGSASAWRGLKSGGVSAAAESALRVCSYTILSIGIMNTPKNILREFLFNKRSQCFFYCSICKACVMFSLTY